MSQLPHHALLATGVAAGPPPTYAGKALTWPNTTAASGTLLPAGSSFTYGSWLKPDYTSPPGYADSENAQYETYHPSSFGILLLRPPYYPDQVRLVNPAGQTFNSSPGLPAGTWSHLLYSYDHTTQQTTLYLNGVARATGTTGDFAELTGFNNGFVPQSPSSNGYVGQKDETFLAAFAFSAADVTACWNKPLVHHPRLADYVAAWPYDDANPAGGVYADLTGHGHPLMTTSNAVENAQVASTVPFV